MDPPLFALYGGALRWLPGKAYPISASHSTASWGKCSAVFTIFVSRDNDSLPGSPFSAKKFLSV
jgi:hypothetical protein